MCYSHLDGLLIEGSLLISQCSIAERKANPDGFTYYNSLGGLSSQLVLPTITQHTLHAAQHLNLRSPLLL